MTGKEEREVVNGIAGYFRAQREAEAQRGETPLPPAFYRVKPEPGELEQAEGNYMKALMAKSPSELTPKEQEWLAGRIGRFLTEGE